MALWPIIDEFTHAKSKGYFIITGILFLHLLLASGFMLGFFHASSTTVALPSSSSTHPSDVKNNGLGQAVKENTENAKREVPSQLSLMQQNETHPSSVQKFKDSGKKKEEEEEKNIQNKTQA